MGFELFHIFSIIIGVHTTYIIFSRVVPSVGLKIPLPESATISYEITYITNTLV